MTNEYKPDYIVTPGEILEDYLDYYNMTAEELSKETRTSLEKINRILKEGDSITFELAHHFKKLFKRPVHYWLNLNKE